MHVQGLVLLKTIKTRRWHMHKEGACIVQRQRSSVQRKIVKVPELLEKGRSIYTSPGTGRCLMIRSTTSLVLQDRPAASKLLVAPCTNFWCSTI